MFFNKKIGYYSSNLDSYIHKLKEGDLSYLSWIFCVFSENSYKHKLIAAKALSEILNEFSIDNIYKIDRQMRETTSMEWHINWHSLNINRFITKQMSENEKYAVFVFATFNPNGYIRKQAIQSLATYKNNLPFILLRCNDWVYQVRQSALALLPEILANANDKEILKALPIMEKLHRSERCKYSDILPIMLNIFGRNNNLIKEGLTNKDVRIRRFCISTINNLPNINSEYLFNHIKFESDPFLRKMIFQTLLKTNTNIIDLINYFLNDKYPPIRMLVLQFLHDNKASTAISTSENMLMDKNARVRALAREFVLQNKADFDIHKHYLDNISINTAISIYGLGEVGLCEDCNFIENFLSNTSISVVCAAMTALMRLNSEKYVSYITEMLAAEDFSIVKTATLLLKKNKGFDFERVLQICNNSLSEYTKIKCAMLLFLSGKWKSLIYTLMLIGNGYEKLDNLCQLQINKWIYSYNCSYAVLPKNDSQIINNLINEKKEFLKPNMITQILFVSK